MDIQTPNSGAVLIYNPALSEEVRVRPFPRLPFLVINYALNHPKVISDSGGTVDKSHLSERIKSFCTDLAALGETERQEITALFNAEDELTFLLPHQRNEKTMIRRWTFDADFLPRKVELLGENDIVLEAFEWSNLMINPIFNPKIFKAF